MNAGIVLAGTDGLSSMTRGPRMSPATGEMSRMKSKEMCVQCRVDSVRHADQQ
jgi:hypothetical protein